MPAAQDHVDPATPMGADLIGARYRFLVDGPGGVGFNATRGPRNSSCTATPDCDALIVDHDGYPWHDAEFRTPAPPT